MHLNPSLMRLHLICGAGLLLVLLAGRTGAQTSPAPLHPQPGQGSVLHYTVHYMGTDYQYTLKVDSVEQDQIILDWSLPELGQGRYLMSMQAFLHGTASFQGQPEAGVDTRLDDSVTLACVSRDFFRTLEDSGHAVYNGIAYTKKDNPKGFSLKGIKVDAVFLSGSDGSRMWLLNDERVPLVLDKEPAPDSGGIGLTLDSIQ